MRKRIINRRILNKKVLYQTRLNRIKRNYSFHLRSSQSLIDTTTQADLNLLNSLDKLKSETKSIVDIFRAPPLQGLYTLYNDILGSCRLYSEKFNCTLTNNLLLTSPLLLPMGWELTHFHSYATPHKDFADDGHEKYQKPPTYNFRVYGGSHYTFSQYEPSLTTQLVQQFQNQLQLIPQSLMIHLSLNQSISDITKKTGRHGHMLLFTHQYNLTLQDSLSSTANAQIQTENRTIIYRARQSFSNTSNSSFYDSSKPHSHSSSSSSSTTTTAAAASPSSQKPKRSSPDLKSSAKWIQKVSWKPDTVQLFKYSALTFNSHKIHYDLYYTAVKAGFKNIVVHGPLLGGLLFEYFKRGIREIEHPKGRKWMVKEWKYRADKVVYVDNEVELCRSGEVNWRESGVADKDVGECELWAQEAETGQVVMKGTAYLETI